MAQQELVPQADADAPGTTAGTSEGVSGITSGQEPSTSYSQQAETGSLLGVRTVLDNAGLSKRVIDFLMEACVSTSVIWKNGFCIV